ncbi:hypothetical protein LVISKB_2316 [Levilactobacillus brevis KB290]|uniref:Uncharacterized protein n=1 Tax=Levilactobacillus brevis KB290 TaxID=1001583 RepID=M5B1K0_LEVBR|nr:hypothetical protein LVISKB_2316 [Levilactobacillus brevis KB290]
MPPKATVKLLHSISHPITGNSTTIIRLKIILEMLSNVARCALGINWL